LVSQQPYALDSIDPAGLNGANVAYRTATIPNMAALRNRLHYRKLGAAVSTFRTRISPSVGLQQGTEPNLGQMAPSC